MKSKTIVDFLTREEFFKRAGIYIIGAYLISMCIPLIVGAKVGLSGPDSYLTSICIAIGKNPNGPWYGYLIWMHYCLLWIAILVIFSIKKCIRKEKWSKREVIYIVSMLIPVFSTGPIVSANSLWIKQLLPYLTVNIFTKYLIFIFGFVFAGFGAACTIWASVLIEPHSSMVLEAQDITKFKFSYLRIGLDVIFFVLAMIIGFSTKQKVFGFDPTTFTENNFPLISFSTILFISSNGFVFGLSLKILKKFLGDNDDFKKNKMKKNGKTILI